MRSRSNGAGTMCEFDFDRKGDNMSNMIQAARQQVAQLTQAAYEKAAQAGVLPAGVEVNATIQIPKDTAHGDYATSFAMAGAKALRKAPRQIAEVIVSHLDLAGTFFDKVEIAGPGFLNFTLGTRWFGETVCAVQQAGADYGKNDMLSGKKYMVEFVSANPTGPMHMGNARGGVLGDTLASVLQKSGADVWREFYVNDAGNQIEKFAKSLEARYFQIFRGEDAVEFPEDGYHGDDIRELARLYADEGRTVLAADVDPDANLGLALGLSQEEVDAIVPISKMRTLVEERTGANEANKFFKLNPYVADIPEKYAKDINGVKLLVMGTVDVGGSGCVCPEHVMLKAILSSLTYRKDDVVIMDMEAGLEHLGRGTAANMDQFIVVIEPGSRSVQTYRNVKRLAADLGVKRVRVVANKIRCAEDEAFIRSAIPAEDLLGLIHLNPEIMDADRKGLSPYDCSPSALAEIRSIKAILDQDEK